MSRYSRVSPQLDRKIKRCFDRCSDSIQWLIWLPVKHGLAPCPAHVRVHWTLAMCFEAIQVISVHNDVEALVSKDAAKRGSK